DELDEICHQACIRRGAYPSPLNYQGFPKSVCTSVNEVICHGIPSPKQVLQEGDIIGIDIGVLYKGWIGDACRTFAVGAIDDQSQRLMGVAQRCLELGIEQARPNHRLGDIGAAIQKHAESNGFSTVRDLVGHGVGHELWEEPQVPHFGTPGTGIRIQPGMVFTIEPMINVGRPEIRTLPDRWTIRTADGSRSAQFEHTMAITDHGAELLTIL
ncbi:MAG TPA: type I methionyl aminopeptidase, partial [Chloroflexota bacterium]|nr:type I methionyl aminopeptidase [Chloroflexota bacterium]